MMKYPIDRTDRIEAARIIGIYSLFAALWIYFSDQAVGLFVREREMMVRLSVYKGFLFIVVTALLLYKLIVRHIWKTREVEKDLRKSRNLINALVEGTTDAVFVKDRDGRYILLNKAAAEFSGKPEKEIIGRDDSEIISPGEAAAIMEGDRRVMTERRVMTCEDCLTTADGVYRTFLATKGPIFNDAGEVSGIFGISKDITVIKLSEEKLKEKHDEMERFTYMISHDLKSPLITVTTFLGYLAQDLERADGKRANEDMRHINDAAGKMGKLLEELLEISRIGRTVNAPVRATFRELVDEAVLMVAGQVTSRGVALRIGDERVLLSGDRPRLVAIWQNLVENAVKYMGDQKSPVVEIGVEGSGPGSVFFVRDNGMGIDRENRERIFGFCAKLDPSSEGIGLGLAVVKRIIELYGGKIAVESEGLGRGACFRFTLPEAFKNAEDAQ